jgi:hypothetical protein
MVVSGSGSDAPTGAGGLRGLRHSVAASNPELYRHLALYLQVLRNVLGGRVRQACFHLATQVHAQRYLNLPQARRLALQQLIQERVQHCCSLLTVEQLAARAGSLEQEQQELRHRRQRRLLQRLLSQADGDGGSEAAAAASGEQPPSSLQEPGDPPPPGSVRLDLTPPLDPAVLGWSVPSDWGASASAWTPERSGHGDADDLEDDQEWLQEDADALDADGEGEDPARDGPPQDGMDPSQGQPDLDAAAWMAALMQGLLGEGEASQERPEDSGSPSGGTLESRLAPDQESPPSPGMGENPPQPPSPWEEASLPQDPVQLLRWLDGLERALVRRLRDLSHAINGDLLRFGLSRGLLPESLLEAVLKGQVETLSSPANVLRLQLPFGLSPGAPPLQAIAILLRPADLEMEEPRLRTCRRRIHQHRQQVRKMAESYRRLQRRLQAHEAERLWLQDIQAIQERGS